MRAHIKAGPVGVEVGGANDLLLMAGLGLFAYFFITRQVLPDAGRAVVSAGGAVAAGANAAANKAAQIITGNPYATAGTAAWEILHPGDRTGEIATAPTYPPRINPNAQDLEDAGMGPPPSIFTPARNTDPNIESDEYLYTN